MGFEISSRYLKAYGAELINMEQFKEAMQELKTKQAVLERQIGHLQGQKQETDTIIRPSDTQIEDFCKAAQFVVMNNQLSFTGKQVIMRKAIDTIIAKQRELRIRGYLSIQEVKYVKSWSEYRNCWITKCREEYVV